MIRAAICGARLGGDPVERETRAGKLMVTASAAVNVAKPGEEPATEWIGIVAFGTVGESLARHEKGDLIDVMGNLTRSTFTDRNGQERTNWSILAEAILSVRPTGNERPAKRRDAARPAQPRRRSLYSSGRAPGDSIADVPQDWVDDLYAEP